MKVAVITTVPLARGFALLGLECYGVEDANKAMGHVNDLIKRDDIGLILITENFYLTLKDEILKLRLELTRPVILDIPDMAKPHRKQEFISEFVLRNTGISI